MEKARAEEISKKLKELTLSNEFVEGLTQKNEKEELLEFLEKAGLEITGEEYDEITLMGKQNLKNKESRVPDDDLGDAIGGAANSLDKVIALGAVGVLLTGLGISISAAVKARRRKGKDKI